MLLNIANGYRGTGDTREGLQQMGNSGVKLAAMLQVKSTGLRSPDVSYYLASATRCSLHTPAYRRYTPKTDPFLLDARTAQHVCDWIP